MQQKGDDDSACFGIIQGGMYPDLRLQNLEVLSSIDFDGLAIGGLSVGEPIDERMMVLESLMPEMSENIPRFIDSEKRNYNMDIDLIEKSISEKTGAIIVTHLFGNPINAKKIESIVKKSELKFKKKKLFFNAKPTHATLD